MALKSISPQMGRTALRALIKEGSPLGPLKVMAQQIGHFCQIPIPGFRPFVVFGSEANRKVLVTDRNKVLWCNTDPVTDLLRRGMLVTDGDEHDRYRSLMEPSLHTSVLSEYKQKMIEQTDRVSSTWKNGEPVDMLVEGRQIALLIIMQTLFGKDVWDDLTRIWTPIIKAIKYISPGMWIFWRRMPRFGFKKHLKMLDDYLYQIISDRRTVSVMKSASLLANSQEQAPALHTDLLQHLINAGLSDDVIRDQMLTMLIAGHDTSTALLAWTFALLGQHPDVPARLVEEVNTQEKSALLDQVIKESLRLYPPIHVGNRQVVEEIKFYEGNVPAGERMFYSIYLTHRDPSIWENAEDFCPERFTRGQKTPPFSYIPFGGGPRACIGAAFGQAEARIVIARLLQTHTFEFANHKIHAYMGATLEPRPGVRMRVYKRSPAALLGGDAHEEIASVATLPRNDRGEL